MQKVLRKPLNIADRPTPQVSKSPRPSPMPETPGPKRLPHGFAPLPPVSPVGPLARATEAATRARIDHATPAKMRARHGSLIGSLIFMVIIPLVLAFGYLHRVALDQYSSDVTFSVRSEEARSPLELLGGLADLSGTSSSDADVLFDYTRSQHIVAAVQARLDVESRWTRLQDTVFGLSPNPSIETLHHYWNRMVRVRYDPATGLINIRALAFTPHDAQAITQAIFTESSNMINALSEAARDDSIQYAQVDFQRAKSELRQARLNLIEFRTQTQIVDPAADMQGRMGLVASLQQELANVMIEVQSLEASNRANRTFALQEVRERATIIEGLIEKERRSLTSADHAGGVSYAALVAQYESLQVDLEFAQEAYGAARATLDAALADAQRKTRYLAAHVPPTLPETAEHPRRLMILTLLGGALFLIWALAALIFYAVRDRR